MTLIEAIKTERETAEHSIPKMSEYHEQIASWLEEKQKNEEKIRDDVIEEFESLLYQFGFYDSFSTKLVIYHEDLRRLIQQLKGAE